MDMALMNPKKMPLGMRHIVIIIQSLKVVELAIVMLSHVLINTFFLENILVPNTSPPVNIVIPAKAGIYTLNQSKR